MYIVGRMKDLIVVRGRNYAPSDVEQIWSDIFDPTSRSAAVQIEVQDKQHVVLVAEVGRSAARSIAGPDIEAMAQDLRGAVIDRLELRITDLVLVAEGAIPRTTSGKIRRAKVCEMILEGALTIVGAAGPLATKLPGCSKQLAVVTQ
jgi:acyl-CoA synthetase (AMP-forming)/AMP-acid ligase II